MIDTSTDRIWSICHTLLDTLPEMAYSMTELLMAIIARNGKEFKGGPPYAAHSQGQEYHGQSPCRAKQLWDDQQQEERGKRTCCGVHPSVHAAFKGLQLAGCVPGGDDWPLQQMVRIVAIHNLYLLNQLEVV